MKAPIFLRKASSLITENEILQAAPYGKLIVCDFSIQDAEKWKEKPWGFERGRIINIDHHAPASRMYKHISSTNLAMKYVHANGIAPQDSIIILNHMDCDSVLSAAIVRGDIEPDKFNEKDPDRRHGKFGQAAIAADHTGDANEIADLLQAIQESRYYIYSLSQLRALLGGNPLSDAAKNELKSRESERLAAIDLVKAGAFHEKNGIFWAQIQTPISGEFLYPQLPQAKIIVLFYPHPDIPDRWINRVRRGKSASEEISLENIKKIDVKYGGRWNAGSNRRGGGNDLSPAEYMKNLIPLFD